MRIKNPWIVFLWFCIGMVLGLFILTGCKQLDNFIRDANDAAAGGQAFMDSSAGALVPPGAQTYAALALSAATGAAAIYKQWRLSQMSKTTKAIVRGLERAETEGRAADPIPGNPTSAPGNPMRSQPGYQTSIAAAKAAIGSEMRKAGIYDTGNKIVERLKLA